MRIASVAGLVIALATLLAAGCAMPHLDQGGGGAPVKGDGGTEGGDAALIGAGCGTESGSGQKLCIATSACPKVVVDTQALPHCGFRLKGSSSELVCACGDSICSMGAFTTCAQAAALLTSQTEAAVCTQVAEGRCFAGTPSTSSSSGSNPGCDRSCLQECGTGAGCKSICGC